jgi:hypothetical protein
LRDCAKAGEAAMAITAARMQIFLMAHLRASGTYLTHHPRRFNEHA